MSAFLQKFVLRNFMSHSSCLVSPHHLKNKNTCIWVFVCFSLFFSPANLMLVMKRCTRQHIYFSYLKFLISHFVFVPKDFSCNIYGFCVLFLICYNMCLSPVPQGVIPAIIHANTVSNNLNCKGSVHNRSPSVDNPLLYDIRKSSFQFLSLWKKKKNVVHSWGRCICLRVNPFCLLLIVAYEGNMFPGGTLQMPVL